jgi:hypothetical protein
VSIAPIITKMPKTEVKAKEVEVSEGIRGGRRLLMRGRRPARCPQGPLMSQPPSLTQEVEEEHDEEDDDVDSDDDVPDLDDGGSEACAQDPAPLPLQAMPDPPGRQQPPWGLHHASCIVGWRSNTAAVLSQTRSTLAGASSRAARRRAGKQCRSWA